MNSCVEWSTFLKSVAEPFYGCGCHSTATSLVITQINRYFVIFRQRDDTYASITILDNVIVANGGAGFVPLHVITPLERPFLLTGKFVNIRVRTPCENEF
jgi:hypothetical protein